MKYIAIYAILFYRAVITPLRRSLFGQYATCRYPVSCSEYALSVIKAEGFITGTKKTFQRLAHCHPWTHAYERA